MRLLRSYEGRVALEISRNKKVVLFIAMIDGVVDIYQLSERVFDSRYYIELDNYPIEKAVQNFLRPLGSEALAPTERALSFLGDTEMVRKAATAALPSEAAPRPATAKNVRKAAEPKDEAQTGRRGAPSKYDEKAKIKVVEKEPKFRSEDRAKNFALYSTCKTVGEFLAAGGDRKLMASDVRHGRIEIS